MKKALAGLVAGIVLGTAGVAGAASMYWAERGAGYACEGISTGVTCTAGNWQVGVVSGGSAGRFLYLQHRHTEEMFSCRPGQRFSQCIQG